MAEDFSAIATVVLPVGDGEQRAAATALVHLRVVGPLAAALTGKLHLVEKRRYKSSNVLLRWIYLLQNLAGSIFPYLLMPQEKKHLGKGRFEPKSSCFANNRSNIWPLPLGPFVRDCS